MSESFHEELEKVATPAVAAEIAARARDLAASFSVVLASVSAAEARNLLKSLVLAICNEFPASNKNGEGTATEQAALKTPVPAEVIEQALRDFDDAATVQALQSIRESGGLTLDDFYGDLERLVRSGK